MLTVYVIKPKPNPSCEDLCMWIALLAQHGFEFVQLGSRFRGKKKSSRIFLYVCSWIAWVNGYSWIFVSAD